MYIPVDKPKVSLTDTPLAPMRDAPLYPSYAETQARISYGRDEYDEFPKFGSSLPPIDRKPLPPRNVRSTPDKVYLNNISYKYSAWRRIEDTRKVYSLTGILIQSGRKYTMELALPLTKLEDQKEAIKQLIDATVEYGYVAPEPCTERWIHSPDDELNEMQNMRIELYNLYQEHDLLDYKHKDEREAIYKFLNRVENPRIIIEELVDKYETNMFDSSKPTYKKYKRYINKRLKKKPVGVV